ncbi:MULTISPECIES: RIP metalloprotease RseP [Sellimonas]|uniref:Zinc metalloprotease n=1 Tax=Sellimonas caecigallum TaxID=2592333 RepID=A0ABS7L9R6_9FIRM|nr:MULTISPECIES: RIP metalloprotease RseP [Sellimonas]MBY0759833.1 RIP metalloprotease RseP [Sellimonas caecigallum]OUP00711.1 RIP metalloprotease RseP [Drancourtella sp. An210]OUP63633.1 RIP metalloprotease RseP [Drancourtella sp. An177]
MGIILAIILFGFIIFFHELGHFLLAKANGIEVQEFAIGMGPKLVGFQRKETFYAIRLLPLGGYCAMGEDEEDGSVGNFNQKSVWRRISVIAAGPVFNFILAFVLALIITAWIGADRPIVANVDASFPAAEAGMKEGDVIKEINGKNIHLFREVTTHNQLYQNQPIDLTYERDGKETTVHLEPMLDEELGMYRFGFSGGAYEKMNVFDTVRYSGYVVKYWISSTLESLKLLVTGQVSVKNLSGPVGIVDVVQDTYNQSRSGGVPLVALNMMNLMILLSANLGVMNLLPLPALDGGRLVFLLIEAVRKKRIPPEKEGYVHMIGMACLLLLMVFVMFNDIQRIFFG